MTICCTSFTNFPKAFFFSSLFVLSYIHILRMFVLRSPWLPDKQMTQLLEKYSNSKLENETSIRRRRRRRENVLKRTLESWINEHTAHTLLNNLRVRFLLWYSIELTRAQNQMKLKLKWKSKFINKFDGGKQLRAVIQCVRLPEWFKL